MDKKVNKLYWLLIITLIMVVIIGVNIFSGSKVNIKEQIFGGTANPTVNVVGSRSGTSTTAVGFSITSSGGQSSTTTYPSMIGADVDTAIYSLYAKNASSTANLTFSVLGSNDGACNTATTSPDVGNPVLKQDIRWVDIGDHLKGKVHSTSLSNATTTLVWPNPLAETGRELILTDLSFDCLALQVSGSSTALQAQLKTISK